MPTYDYQCRSCGSVTELIHSMLEEGPSVCERCGGVLRRVIFPTGIIFKGSGFYRNDSRKASPSAVGDSDGSGGSGSAPDTAKVKAEPTPAATSTSTSTSTDAGSSTKGEASAD